MHKLLIVDDEEMIVKWLRNLLQNVDNLDLDISVAYSGTEALAILSRLKIDIVLTDIKMPGMNGIQLLERINCTWPQCRVIFLTGYNEFDYVYSAIHHENVSFLLKTEKDVEILKVVEKAARSIEKSYMDQEMIKRTYESFTNMLPILRKEFLADLLEGSVNTESVQQQLNALEIPFHAESAVLLLIGCLDNLSEKTTTIDRSRYFYSVKLLAEKYFPKNMISIHLVHRNSVLVWLVQQDEAASEMQNCGRSWEQIVALFKGTLDTIQVSCMETFGLSVSFAYNSEPVDWSDICIKYEGLRRVLSYKSGLGTEMILTEKNFREHKEEQSSQNGVILKKLSVMLKKAEILGSYLSKGQRVEFFELLSSMVGCIKEIGSINTSLAVEMYYSIAILLLSYENRWETINESHKTSDLHLYIGIDEHQTLNQAMERLTRFAEMIFDIQSSEKTKDVNDCITKVKLYISYHLKEDLSLTTLAEYVYLNPSYLSRLFKQSTGGNLKEYIMSIRLEKAKELLKNSDFRIHEVASAVGFDYSNYFTNFFKKKIGITPQEFRDSYSNR